MLLTFLENIVAPVFYKLLYMSVTALVVGMIVMLIRRFADKRFSPFWKYAMWVLVLAALILPWRPQSNLAVMNTTEKIQEVSFRNEYVEAQAGYEVIKQNNSGYSSIEPLSNEIEAKNRMETLRLKTLIFDSLLPALWLCGTVMIGLFMFISGLRLGRKIKGSMIAFETARYENALQSCKQKFGMKRRVQIILQGYVKTPALLGLWRPKIILPGYVENFSDEHLEYVILHELSHLKRMDGVVNTLLLALQTIYWFNPLTWFLFKFIREDMELANDAAVLKGMRTEEQKEYSLSLVEVLAGYGKPGLTSKLLCMVDSEKNIERRINMIKLGEFFRKRRLIIAIAGMLVIAITATLFLTAGAVNADNYEIDITSDMIDKVEQISQGHYQSIRGDGFLITASKIHKAYKQDDKIRVFATTYYSAYTISNDGIIQGSAGVVPASITYTEPIPGQFAILDYTEAKDGSYFKPAVEDFCRLPSGRRINGLASEIINHYGNDNDLNELHQKKLDEYMNSHGLSGYSVQNTEPEIPEEPVVSNNTEESKPETPDESVASDEMEESEPKIPREPVVSNNAEESEPKIPDESEPETLIKSALFNSAEEVESMTDERLLELATQNYQFVIPGFFKPDDFGVQLEQGEGWQRERWQEIALNSFSTVSAVENEVKSFALMQNPVSYTIDYIGENKYYYEFRLKYTQKIARDAQETITYTKRVIVYKDSAKYCTFNNQTGYFAQFCVLDGNSVLELLDLEVFLHYDIRSVIYREFKKTADEYIYTFYRIEVVYGDWDVNDTAHLKKTEMRVNKKTGEYITLKAMRYDSPQRQNLKEVVIPGTAKPSPVLNGE